MAVLSWHDAGSSPARAFAATFSTTASARIDRIRLMMVTPIWVCQKSAAVVGVCRQPPQGYSRILFRRGPQRADALDLFAVLEVRRHRFVPLVDVFGVLLRGHEPLGFGSRPVGCG